MKVAGFCTGHDCSYAILENGIPIIHNELERFIRAKEPTDDAIKFMCDTEKDVSDISYFTHCIHPWGDQSKRYPESHKKLLDIVKNNNGEEHYIGHHQAHAANAFFSSNFDNALIITLDGGGHDRDQNGNVVLSAWTAWEGNKNKISPIEYISNPNLGAAYGLCSERIFGHKQGFPYGNKSGTVMAMAAMGDEKKYFRDFYNHIKRNFESIPFSHYNNIVNKSEQDKFDVAAGLQKACEIIVKEKIDEYIKKYSYEYLCLSGGAALNSVIVGKLYEWYPNFKDIYVDPVPYDGGLALGSARYVWHHILDNPRIEWKDNSTPYLGKTYSAELVRRAIDKSYNDITLKVVKDEDVINLLTDKNVISIFGGGSESGRRALGNRSILADPRSDKMKEIINEKVKHREWFRPFAPSILREEVGNWFEIDINSPYMTAVIKFKKEVTEKVPAVVHFDRSARLQTVTEKDNKWYYNFIKLFAKKTGVPILLNTSFNDREPIVETPEHAINCFLGTDIDYLYFRDYNMLISKKRI